MDVLAYLPKVFQPCCTFWFVSSMCYKWCWAFWFIPQRFVNYLGPRRGEPETRFDIIWRWFVMFENMWRCLTMFERGNIGPDHQRESLWRGGYFHDVHWISVFQMLSFNFGPSTGRGIIGSAPPTSPPPTLSYSKEAVFLRQHTDPLSGAFKGSIGDIGRCFP